MCRRNQLVGCCAGAFGLGLLIGGLIESSVLCALIGLGAIAAGFCLLQRK